MTETPVKYDNVPGNYFDKYNTRNPIARYLMNGFLDTFDELTEKTGTRSAYEVGCGEGFLSMRLHDRGWNVHGSDLEIVSVAEANHQCASRGIARKFETRSLFDLKPEEARAELVICCEVLEHVPQTERALAVLKSLANPYLLLSVPREPIWRMLNVARGKYIRGLGNTPGHIQHWSSAAFLDLLQRSVTIVEVRKPLPGRWFFATVTETTQATGIGRTRRMKSAIRVAGVAVSLAALVFVGLTVYRSFDDLRQHLASPLFLVAVAGSTIAYAIILQFVGLAWHRLLTAVDGPSLGVGQALAICGRTQIYKYLPSNVLHMVGRYAFARRSLASNKALAFAQIGELLTIVLAAAVLAAVLARPVLVRALVQHGLDDQALANAVMVSGFIVLTMGIALVVRFRMAETGRKAIGALAAAFVIYMLFFIGNGLLVVALCKSLAGAGAVTEIIGIGAGAWLVGFVVPGAPGGLGVREAVLIAGLSAAGLPPTEATAVALGHRFVTMVGDVVVATAVMLIAFRR